MSGDSPLSSRSPQLPPRHRPTLGNLNKNTIDTGLWDDIEDIDDLELKPSQIAKETKLPKPRPSFESQSIEAKPASQNIPASPRNKDAMMTNITRAKPGERNPLNKTTAPLARVGDIDDLSDWDDVPATPRGKKTPLEKNPLTAPETAEDNETKSEKSSTAEIPEVELAQNDDAKDEPAEAQSEDEMVPEKVDLGFGEFVEKKPLAEPDPSAWKQSLRISTLEGVGLSLMVLILLASSVIFVVAGINRLPKIEEPAVAADFPMNGKSITIQSVDTFWRKPISTGENADTFRRGSVLLPVMEISCSKGSAALRIIFRDSEGTAMGDTKVINLRKEQKVQVVGTAGFEEIGLFTSYRAGNEKPWTIEVYEASSIDGSGNFVSLFKTNISINQR